MKPLIFAASVFFSGAAFADNFYVGLDYAYNELEIADETVNPNAVNLNVGYELFDGVSLLGQYAVSTTDDDLYRMNFDIDQAYAVFARFESPSSYGFSVDVQLGWSWTDLAVAGPQETYNAIDSYNGFAWGIGFNQQIPQFEQIKLRFGYQALQSETDLKLAAYTLGLSYSF